MAEMTNYALPSPEFIAVKVRDLRSHWSHYTNEEMIMLALSELLMPLEDGGFGPSPYVRAIRNELFDRATSEEKHLTKEA